MDAADFKTYIFPLLFFKRICDVWDDEYAEIVADTGDAELALFPESHRFQIPEACHWNDVRAVATNVGNALQRAMREIEKANPTPSMASLAMRSGPTRIDCPMPCSRIWSSISRVCHSATKMSAPTCLETPTNT